MSKDLKLELTGRYGEVYWAYNCPLQMWPIREDEDSNKVTGWRVLNYMPRRERVDELGENLDPCELKSFCNNAATILKNLAHRFELLADGKIDTIYYPDDTE